MASLNRVDLIGRLGADPEVRRMASGDPVINMRLAVSETWRDRNSGERRERTEWVNVVIFNEQIGKVAEQYLKKGSQVYVSGSLQTRKWQDQSGQDRYSTEVVLQKFRGELQMLDTKGASEGQPRQQSQSYADQSSGYGQQPVDLGDEVPFAPSWK